MMLQITGLHPAVRNYALSGLNAFFRAFVPDVNKFLRMHIGKEARRDIGRYPFQLVEDIRKPGS